MTTLLQQHDSILQNLDAHKETEAVDYLEAAIETMRAMEQRTPGLFEYVQECLDEYKETESVDYLEAAIEDVKLIQAEAASLIGR